MDDIAITRLSSKGQVVIPSEMRKELKAGEKLILIKAGHQIILKKASDLDEKLKEDLEFARRTEKAYQKYKKGESIEMDSEEFLEELNKW